MTRQRVPHENLLRSRRSRFCVKHASIYLETITTCFGHLLVTRGRFGHLLVTRGRKVVHAQL